LITKANIKQRKKTKKNFISLLLGAFVRFLPPSINKNDKPDRKKNHEYLANGSTDFNRTKKFGISAKNYTRKEPKINNSDQGWDTELDKKIRQPKKIEECNQEKNRRNTTTMEIICETYIINPKISSSYYCSLYGASKLSKSGKNNFKNLGK
jgi:hypothetical protein